MEKKLKRAVIKEELIEITGNFARAVILNQFIYWAERVKDFDEFIRQENAIAERHGEPPKELTAGWIYKTAEELASETMLGLSKSNMRNHIKALVEMGFISERNNPKYKWDRTIQYRVNLTTIERALRKKGYHLDGYAFADFTELQGFETKLPSHETELQGFETKSEKSRNETAIPKITTDTTSKIITEDKKEKDKKESADTLPSTNTKTKKTKSTDDYSIFEEFAGSNTELLQALKDFLEMREMIKKPMSERAMTKLIKELQKLSDNADVWIEILEQSILNNWQGVFPLKDNKGGVNGGSTTTNSTQSGGSEWSRFEHDKFCI